MLGGTVIIPRRFSVQILMVLGEDPTGWSRNLQRRFRQPMLGVLSSPLKGYVTQILQKYLGKYIKGIELEGVHCVLSRRWMSSPDAKCSVCWLRWTVFFPVGGAFADGVSCCLFPPTW